MSYTQAAQGGFSKEAPARRDSKEVSLVALREVSGARSQECPGPEQDVASVLKDSKNATEAGAERARQRARADELDRKVEASQDPAHSGPWRDSVSA